MRHPGFVEVGLVTDLMSFLVSPMDTAISRTHEEIYDRYSHHRKDDLDQLVSDLLALYLVSPVAGGVKLGHDLLAPLTRLLYQRSVSPGQQADRLLQQKLALFEDPDAPKLPSMKEAAIIESGKMGMFQPREVPKEVLWWDSDWFLKREKGWLERNFNKILGFGLAAALVMGLFIRSYVLPLDPGFDTEPAMAMEESTYPDEENFSIDGMSEEPSSTSTESYTYGSSEDMTEMDPFFSQDEGLGSEDDYYSSSSGGFGTGDDFYSMEEADTGPSFLDTWMMRLQSLDDGDLIWMIILGLFAFGTCTVLAFTWRKLARYLSRDEAIKTLKSAPLTYFYFVQIFPFPPGLSFLGEQTFVNSYRA